MSIVKYHNKKTGYISVYESTSNYDPVTKQSRPVRKYLGHEDPETGELIRSTGKPGRRKALAGKASDNTEWACKYNDALAVIEEKDLQISRLSEENARLRTQVAELKTSIKKASACFSQYLE